MKQDEISLAEALSKKLPEMVKNKEALTSIVEMVEESFFSGNFDVHSNIVEELTGLGGYGEFSIYIHEFHGIFWISAPEFDDDGYFTSKEDAISFAEDRYNSFL
jgi:hypothetical protein